MGQLKKIKNLLDSYEKLPNGSFKKTVGEDIEKIKEIYAEVHSLKKMKDKLDDKYCKGCGELSPVCYCDYQLEVHKDLAQTHDHDDCMITYVNEDPPVVSMFTKDKGILDGKPGTDADFHKEAKENERG